VPKTKRAISQTGFAPFFVNAKLPSIVKVSLFGRCLTSTSFE
jgi:hypothetical protein